MFAKRKFWIEYAINDCDDQFGIEDLSKLNKIRLRTPNARPPKIIRKKLPFDELKAQSSLGGYPYVNDVLKDKKC